MSAFFFSVIHVSKLMIMKGNNKEVYALREYAYLLKAPQGVMTFVKCHS